MADFGVEVKNCKEVSGFVAETNERLSVEHILNNPFHGRALFFEDTIAIHIKPIYLNFPLIAFAIIFPITLFFRGLVFNWLYIVAGIFFVLSLFWSKYFFFLMFKLGLRKAGYKEKIKMLKSSETIRRLIDYGAKRGS